jgi:transposase
MQYIAFDSHKHYTLARVEKQNGLMERECRIPHDRQSMRTFLNACEPESPVAIETVGNWYWIVDEIEHAGLMPRLVHARKAKLMMGLVNKTDSLDAEGLNLLQRTGALPTVWIPPGSLRDKRELPRTRMLLVKQRTQLKNRIHATLAKYAVSMVGVSDIFGRKGMAEVAKKLDLLPPETRFVTQRMIKQVQQLNSAIDKIEKEIVVVFKETHEIKLLQTMYGVGRILSVVIALEVGDVARFARADKLAAYSGTVPRIHASGGHTRYGQLRSDVNHYLKWALVEAANTICMHRGHHPHRHVSRLYERVMRRKGHQKAIGAVARHLAEAVYWILTKQEPYREPICSKVSSTGAQARGNHGAMSSVL